MICKPGYLRQNCAGLPGSLRQTRHLVMQAFNKVTVPSGCQYTQSQCSIPQYTAMTLDVSIVHRNLQAKALSCFCFAEPPKCFLTFEGAPKPFGTVRAPPRRRKPVPRACDSCRRRKNRCDGQKPCRPCLSHNKLSECVYNPSGRPSGSLDRQAVLLRIPTNHC